jgi:cyanate lyase
VPSNNAPYANLPSICSALFEAKARNGTHGVQSEVESLLIFRIAGLTFDQIAKAIGRDEVWVAAAFYGQVNLHYKDCQPCSRFIGEVLC